MIFKDRIEAVNVEVLISICPMSNKKNGVNYKAEALSIF